MAGVNRVLKYEIGADSLYKEIMAAIASGIKESVDVNELTEICERAVKEAPEDIVVNIIRLVSEIGKKCAEKRMGDETFWVVYKFRDIGIESVERGFEEASFFAATGLKTIGIEAAKTKLSGGLSLDIARDVIVILREIGAKAAEKGLEKWGTTIRTVEGIKKIGMELENKYVAVNGLWCMAAFVMRYLPEQAVPVIHHLKEMEEEIGRDVFMRWGESCVSDYPDLKSSLEEFKKLYERQDTHLNNSSLINP